MTHNDHWSGFRPDKIAGLRQLAAVGDKAMFPLVYFSSQSENTHRFITRLGLPARRIPLDATQRLHIDQPYILVVPSYGGGSARGAVPKQVIQFLNDDANRRGIRGVIAAGNRNFGAGFCRRATSLRRNVRFLISTALS